MGRLYDLDVIIFASGMPMNGDTIPSGRSLGGSETSAIQASESLASLGHHVTLYCNTEMPHEANGVAYRPLGWVPSRTQSNQFPKAFVDHVRSTPHDVLIIQRLPAMFGWEYASKVNFLWQHDLATQQGPSNFLGVMWNLDRVFVLSEFQKKQYQQVHGGPDDLYHVTRNGIDLDLIDSTARVDCERDRFSLTYTARPERGLDNLLKIVFPKILEKEPRARLYISRYEDPATLPLYQELGEYAKRFGDRVIDLGNLGKAELYDNYRRSRLFLYPTCFEEISHITIMEAGACGSVMVGAWKAATPETANGSHVLIRQDGTIGKKGDPVDPGFVALSKEFVDTFVNQTVDLMHDDIQWTKLSKQARKQAEGWTWKGVAEDWSNLAHELIEQRSSKPRAMTKHFLVNSDVVAAMKYVEERGDDWCKAQVNEYVDRFVPFLRCKDAKDRKAAIAAFYEARSGGANANWQTAFFANQEIRLQVLLPWLKDKIDRGEIKSVLDFGCAHGGYVKAIAEAFPQLEHVMGVDVSPSLIRCAEELKSNAMAPDVQHRVSFAVADEDTKLDRRFDCVIAMEVLEHLPNSEDVAKKLERHCHDNGWMVVTVPHGHRERDELVTKGIAPVHIRSFDLHDMRELFGKKKDFAVMAFTDQLEVEFDKTFAGWWMAMYRPDNKPLGQIDWERKFFLQGPRDTLAVCMITNNNEDILHRSLRSIAPIADQIIIVDNGPSYDRTMEVSAEYTRDVRIGTSPFWCYVHAVNHGPEGIDPNVCDMAGFETPRNESIEGVWADWIAWIDSDEQLLDRGNLYKYLRPNSYTGYAINQHHISVDPPGALKRDIPVRLFRANHGMKAHGKVHEHFELGINKGVGSDCIVLHDINLHHDGYLTESIRRGRFKRNIKLLQCDRRKYPDRLLGVFLYEVRDCLHLARYALERNNGVVNDEARSYCETVINTYKEKFLGTQQVWSLEGLNYYSDALAILGRGIEVAFDIDIKQVGAHLNGGAQRCRVDNADEVKLLIGMKINEQSARLVGPYSA